MISNSYSTTSCVSATVLADIMGVERLFPYKDQDNNVEYFERDTSALNIITDGNLLKPTFQNCESPEEIGLLKP
jgi:hypothetical protein